MSSHLRGSWVFLVCSTLAGLLAGSVVVRAEDGKSSQFVVMDKQGHKIGSYRGSYALVIGVSDYTGGWPTLPGVKQDVRLVTQALEKSGFQVEVVENPDQEKLENAYRDFIRRYGSDTGNRLLFYFAGHGYTRKPPYSTDDPREWRGYIVARDAPLPTPDFAAFSPHALSMDQFSVIARDIDANHALFLFDSCFSGTIFALSRARPVEVSEQTARPVRQFISSGAPDQEVPDTSEFRRQFIFALAGEGDTNHDGYVTGSELGQFLQESVEKYTNGAQTPQYGKIRDPRLDKGDFVFQVASLAPVVPSPEPLPLDLRGHLQVNVNVPTAQVSINGKAVGIARNQSPLWLRDLDAGRVRVRVEADGYEPMEQDVDIQVKAWTQKAFILQPLAKASLPAEPQPSAKEEKVTALPPPVPPPPEQSREESALPPRPPQDSPRFDSTPLLKNVTPSHASLSLFTHQSRFFGVQAIPPNAVDSPLLYTWKIDGQATPGRELIEFKGQPVGTHTVEVMVTTLSGETVLAQNWTVDVRTPIEGKDPFFYDPSFMEIFDLKNAVADVKQQTFTVSGKVRNEDQRATDNVVVWVTVLDENSRPVAERVVLLEPQTLRPGEAGKFEATFQNRNENNRILYRVESR